MNTETPPAPTLETRSARHGNVYPAPDTMLGAAWDAAWRIMAADPSKAHVGSEVATEVAQAVQVAPVTVSNLLARFAVAGKLERAEKRVKGTRGARVHATYRIPS